MKIFRKILAVLIVVAIGFGLYVINEGYQMYKEAVIKTPIAQKVEEIKSKNNYTEISQMPDIYLKAVVSVEDHRFYYHHGIDLIAICRALFNDIKARKFVEGGSTITQQLAKNTYFTQEKKIKRKIAEVFMVFEMERDLTKEEILELYLNTSYFGSGYYTVEEASLGYFEKEPINMSYDECIMLAGIPNAPSVYSPKVNPELAKQRQKQVLNALIKYGNLSPDEINIIKASVK